MIEYYARFAGLGAWTFLRARNAEHAAEQFCMEHQPCEAKNGTRTVEISAAASRHVVCCIDVEATTTTVYRAKARM